MYQFKLIYLVLSAFTVWLFPQPVLVLLMTVLVNDSQYAQELINDLQEKYAFLDFGQTPQVNATSAFYEQFMIPLQNWMPN